ncbi:hypothetical protein [Streptomyces coffeae]|uniref:Uncharacterized protein n=1 Tax=Streptomyces coffeae TaxID=621382 RepID=A0ABS1N5K6_9ACTN|nr:hypothetical protein [Streptomyces coffeae]MBL1095372.1 hypothetical protein [Streptomyces coffeae]
MISHVTLDQKDVSYDHRVGHAAFAVTVHHRDGTTEPSLLTVDPGQVELYALQLERAIAARKAAVETKCR